MTEHEYRTMVQQEAREQTLATLPAFLEKLAAHKHDYGTICVAIGAAAIGAAWALEHSPSGGITGFQAGAVMWEFIRAWDANGVGDNPQRIINYGDLLYPQMEDKFTAVDPDTWEWAQRRAKELLAERNGAVETVVQHWQRVAAGVIPFGLRVAER